MKTHIRGAPIVKNIELRDYQKRISDAIVERRRVQIAADMGLGKTLAVLDAIRRLREAGHVRRVLIVAPVPVARHTWPTEARKFDMPFSVAVATAKNPKPTGEVIAANFEIADKLLESYRTSNGEPSFDMVVIDETTRIKGFRLAGGSKRAKALFALVKAAPYYVGMTGTPAPNSLLDLWAQQYFVDFGKRLGKTFTGFRDRFFYNKTPFAPFPTWEVKPEAKATIWKLIQDTWVVIKAEKYFPLEKPIVIDRWVELPPSAMKLYREFSSKMLVVLGADATLEALSASSSAIKCSQIASGACYQVEGGWSEVHSALLDELELVIEESGDENVIVCYQWKHDLSRILKRFPHAVEFSPDKIDDWNAGKIRLMVMHPASAGHGVSLQYGGRRMVFFGLGYNLEHHLQAIERIGPARQKAAGFNRSVFIYRLLARATIHERVASIINRKARDVYAVELEPEAQL